jgi:hypothetical protein
MKDWQIGGSSRYLAKHSQRHMSIGIMLERGCAGRKNVEPKSSIRVDLGGGVQKTKARLFTIHSQNNHNSVDKKGSGPRLIRNFTFSKNSEKANY